MPKTLREGLQEFLRDLKAYAKLDQPADDVDAAARVDVCESHAVRIERLLGLPEHDGVTILVQPEDLCVWAVLPGERAIRLADGSGNTPAAELSDRDRAIIRTLLAVAQNEANGHGQGVPVLPPHGAPASYQAPPPAPWTWGL